MNHGTKLAAAVQIALTGLAAAPAASQAQGMLEEVVVTARQRAESLQSVPLSETAFTATQIEDAKIDQVGDFVALTPNVTLADSQSKGVAFMTIRGVSQVRNGEPPVATVVDGVLQINSRQFTQELFDVEQIEVLRGPQGALYGRNATGGAILIRTKQPTNEFEGYARLGAGKGDELRLQGSVSGPIIEDKLLYRLAGSYVDGDGVLDNEFLNETVDYYEDKTIRGMLKWYATDDLSVDFRANISRSETGAVTFQYQPALFEDERPCYTNESLIFAGGSDADRVSRSFCANNLGEGDRDIDELSLKVDYQLGFADLTAITSWNSVSEYTAGDQYPYTAATNILGSADGTTTQYADIEAWSQELRLTSMQDQRLRWMVGVYYLETDRFVSTTTGMDLREGIVRIESSPQFDSPVNPTLSFLADENDNTAWAVFGSLNYDITDRLEASFAARYDEDEREQLVSPLNTSGAPGAVNTATFDKLQPKLSLRYAFNDDVQVYGSWGEGFRSGQFNQNGVAEAAAAAGLVGVMDVVDQEETETFEVGIKSEWWDNRVRLNGAIYDTTIDGFQYFVFVGEVGAQVLVNIDEVEVMGGELELQVSPLEGLNLYSGIGISDSEVKAYTLNPSAKGNKAPYVPEMTFNLGGQYRFPIGDSLAILTRLDYEHRGEQYWDPENSTARSAINLVRARVGIESIDQTWSIIASVANLTDEKYNEEWVLGGFANPADPRTWSVDFRYNF